MLVLFVDVLRVHCCGVRLSLDRMDIRRLRGRPESIHRHQRFATGKATVFDEIAQDILADVRLVEGDRHRL
jgi:hypothetical protein